MKNSMSNIYKRQQEILQKLYEKEVVSTEELAAELNVSRLTIRRDLQDFASQGLVKYVRGGANLIKGALKVDPSSLSSSSVTQSSKEAIAKLAATLVHDGDTIFINSSSTAILILKYIKNKRVVVVTNNGTAAKLALDPKIELILTGGVVHANKKSMVGEVAVHNLSRITASKVFLGVSGISVRGGITTSVLQEVAVNEMMVRRANHNCIVLADGSKVGVQNNFVIGPATMVSTMITDASADPDVLYQLTEQGIRVMVAE